MLETLVEVSHGGRRTVLQYIKMLSVIALPVAAVIALVSFTLHLLVISLFYQQLLRLSIDNISSNASRTRKSNQPD